MKKLSILILGFSILFLSCSDNSTDSPSLGTIEGQVLNGKTMQHIVGVVISTQPASSSILTESDGSFVLTDVSEGEYVVEAKRYGYNPNYAVVKVIGGKTTKATILLYDFETLNSPPDIPVALVPNDKEIVADIKLTLEWECSDKDNDNLQYDIFLSKQNPPTTLIAQNITENEFAVDNLDTTSTYYWKIIAKDEYTFSESRVYTFTTNKSSELPQDDLILYYSFDDNDASDQSGNGNNGILKNNPSFVTGKSGLAARLIGNDQLDGNGSHILLPSINFSTMNEFTIALWVNEESLQYSAGEAYINFGNASNGWIGISNFIKPPENTELVINFSVGCEAYNNYERQQPVWFPFNLSNRNKWVHYSLTYKNGTTTGYIDGISVGYENHSIGTIENVAAIGKHWWNYNGTHSATSMTFKVDEVRVYKRALSNSEVKALAN